MKIIMNDNTTVQSFVLSNGQIRIITQNADKMSTLFIAVESAKNLVAQLNAALAKVGATVLPK